MVKPLKHYWYLHILVLIGAIFLLNLGFWQLRRLEQRRALNTQIEAGLNALPVPLTGEPVNPDDLHRHRVTVTGTFDNAQTIILQNRPFHGQAGVELLAPLQISGSNAAVLVDRGWIPLDEQEPDARHVYNVTGEITLEGIAYRSQPQPTGWLVIRDRVPASGQDRLDKWFRVDVDGIARQLDYPLLPIFVRQSPGADPAELPAREENFDLSEGSHLSYALQWFSFAVILVVVYSAFLRKQATTDDE